MLTIRNLTVMDIPQRMTSLEIAEITGKMHKDVMRAIRNMEPAWSKVNGRNFALVDYMDAKGQLRPCYSLDKTECLYIATKFNDEARAKLVLRWQTLEKERMERTAATKLLATDADIMSEAERIVGQELMRNNQNADGCITISDIAKAMSMDAKLLNSFLCDKGIQSWQRGQFRLKPEFEGRGLAQDRLFVYYSKKGQQKTRSYLVWTPRGRDFINDLVNF